MWIFACKQTSFTNKVFDQGYFLTTRNIVIFNQLITKPTQTIIKFKDNYVC